jgi:hypothetical protein
MSELPDGRPMRRGDGTTSASSHPELLTGDLAGPPRPYVSVMSLNRAAACDQPGRAWGGMLAIFALVALLSTIIAHSTTSEDATAERQRLARSCLRWHLAASAVVSHLVQSTRDVDLVQVGDSVFRMRRARRNCEAGWYGLACRDYHAVAISTPGIVMGNQVFSCSQVATSTFDRD